MSKIDAYKNFLKQAEAVRENGVDVSNLTKDSRKEEKFATWVFNAPKHFDVEVEDENEAKPEVETEVEEVEDEAPEI